MRAALWPRLGPLLREGALSDRAGDLLMPVQPPCWPTVRVAQTLSAKDKLTICLILFFSGVALTLELYWLTFHEDIENRTDIFARTLSLYWSADRTYRIPGYSPQKAFTLAVEGAYTLVTPWLSALLVWAILKAKPYRYPLQLVIATYASYGTVLYYLVAHIS